MKKDIIYEVKSLENAISRYFFYNLKTDNSFPPPSPIQVGILRYLIENKGKDIYQKDLENIFKVRRASISGVLQTLEKRGLIEKVISEKDGRTNKIIFTEKAIKRQEEANEYLSTLQAKLTKNIPNEKLDVFYEVIEQMINNIEKDN